MSASIRMIRDSRGSVSMLFTLSLIAIVGALGLAIDLGRLYSSHQKMQQIVDAAALAGAQGSTMTEAERLAAAQLYLNTETLKDPDLAASLGRVSVDNSAVRVALESHVNDMFMPALADQFSSTLVSTSAAAAFGVAASSLGQACILALNQTDAWGVNMGSASVLNANCGLKVNNSGDRAINLGSGTMTTAVTAVVGAWETNSSFTYAPAPVNAPLAMPDPLAALVAPVVGGCTYTNKVVTSSDPSTLDPGVYCGGLEIATRNLVTFNPGAYIIQGGAFKMSSSSQAAGTGVFFYLAGDGAVINWGSDVHVTFTAPVSGPAKGMLLWVSGTQSVANVFGSHSSSVLEGTIYSPNTPVDIGCNAIVGSNADWTVWVVRSLEVSSNATLYVQANYALSTTPLPDGLASALAIMQPPSFARLVN